VTSARLAQSGELAQVEIELIGSVDEPGVAIAVVISMLPPSSRSIVFDLVMPSFFSASSNVSGGITPQADAVPGPIAAAGARAYCGARIPQLCGGARMLSVERLSSCGRAAQRQGRVRSLRHRGL
jgi:hypothetical protein